jgi:hypothetical protein
MAAYQGGQRSAAKSPRKPKAPSRRPVRSSDPRTNLPGGRSKPKPVKPTRQGPAVPARLQQAPKAPVLPAPVRTVAARPSTPARPTTSSRRPAPKPPAASSAPKAPKVAQTSGIGPVKSGAEYASKKGSITESLRKIGEMKAASTRRQTGQAAPALSSSKDYSSSFKDMKGGSSRFASELKKKKKAK